MFFNNSMRPTSTHQIRFFHDKQLQIILNTDLFKKNKVEINKDNSSIFLFPRIKIKIVIIIE